jgi:hypothetical protein
MVVHPARAVNPYTPIALDAMADEDDARQPLHIDVHQLARMRPLIAAHHRRRLESSWRDDGPSLGGLLSEGTERVVSHSSKQSRVNNVIGDHN